MVGNAASGDRMLGEFDAEAQKYIVAADSAQEISSKFAQLVGTNSAADWASVALNVGDLNQPIEAEVVDDGFAEEKLTPEQIRSKLEELQNEKALAAEVSGIQDKIDVLHSEQFELEDEMRLLSVQLKEFKAIEDDLARTEALKNVDKSVIDLARNFSEKMRHDQDQQLKQEDDLELSHQALLALKDKPVWIKDPLFSGIVVATAAGFIVPPILKAYNFAVIGFVGLLTAVPWVVWKTLKQINHVKEEEERHEEKVGALKKFIARIDADKKTVESLVEEMKVLDARDVARLFDERTAAEERARQERENLEDAGAFERHKKIQSEINVLIEQAEKLELQLQGVMMGSRDGMTIAREIEELEARLGESAAASAFGGSAVSDEISRIIKVGSQLANMPIPTFQKSLNDFASKIVAASFSGRVSRIEYDSQGTIMAYNGDSILETESEAEAGAIEEIAVGAAQLGMLRIASVVAALPLVWDSEFSSVNDETLVSFMNTVKRAAGPIQLVVFSGREALADVFERPAVSL